MLHLKAMNGHKVESLYATEYYLNEEMGLPVIREFTRTTLQPGYVQEETSSSVEERVFWVLSGELTFVDNGEEFKLHRMDAAHILQDEKYSFRNDSFLPVEILEIDLTVDE